MSEFLQGLKRTAMCGTFRKENAGETAVVMGWVQRSRNLGSIIFTDLRDRSGIVQIVFDETVEKEVFEKAEKIRSEYVLAVKGVVRERSAKTNKIPTGDVEILAEELKILSEAETTPFEILDDTGVNENLRLKYRYLDLRRPSLQKNLITRSEIAVTTRNYLAENGFLEIETPYLGKSTRKGLSRSLSYPPGQLLRASAIPSALQATFNDCGLRQIFSDCKVLPRRGFESQPSAGIYANRP